MSQNIILTQALNYLINKRASLELKSHWNNINMASSIHMSHSLFCFVFIENEIIRIYSAASHRKGLTDAMSSFGVKSILRCDVIGLDQWFAYSKEKCQYLRFRNDERMVYSNIDPKLVDKWRSKKKEIKIKGCMLGHLFVYEPNSTKIFMNEYLCDWDSCLNLEFSSCKKPVVSVGEIGDDFLKECMVDEDDDRQSRIYEFVSTPSYVSLILCNASDPVYFVLVEKKGQATEKLQDQYDHVILPGKFCL